MKKATIILSTFILLIACKQKDNFDASGNFEADEVIVSAQQTGELISYSVQEGALLKANATVGQIDVKIAELQKEQAEATISALQQKTSNTSEQDLLVKKQLAVQEAQLDQQLHERIRTANLVKADAATRKQLDDIDAAIVQLKKQIAVTQQQLFVNNSNNSTQNRSILSEKAPLEKTAAQFQEQINKGRIINPIDGTVLVNYALKGEMQVVGKPLYKIANISTLDLRAYITGTQLPQIKLNQHVKVRIDQGEKGYKEYPGTITWISNKSEFSPKTIQTKDERANLVYAIKIKVKNDGYLKIGMYGETIF
ncbi:HlyD family secretion protein [Chryseobacterium lactis]|uniref:HlyD family efflux transporter periplasmic adaptor subunit n=1 Tax=Chryseobacterium lactis TaxID=1241981 RepID=A0A3G6RIP1_CHRLC|nr:HlyD family efflux transporter periplasmic adaptor subunit [Chryseobacterium lactis]AZA83703.1 HlyD family efflux transporter periplasmic adaptor subunit [Chryseobacterium lactis]AZB04088.1 HlyD family efflux transporter periplasmic adaptor subunit [Chryseobacterium lactis]PNW13004.1 HlyD family secretion protein [Chryseobacterium lactis]